MTLNNMDGVERFRTLAAFTILFSTKAVLLIDPMKVPQKFVRKITKMEASLKVGIIRTT